MRTFLISSLCLAAFFCSAQSINNASFENWHVVSGTNGAEDPDHWESNNKVQDSINGFGVSKSTDARTGNYALKLSPLANSGERYTIITLGELSLDSTGALAPTNCAGDSVSQLPLLLYGYYQYHTTLSTQKNAHAFIGLYETSCQSGSWAPTGMGDLDFTYSNEYVPFAIPITYGIADFALIDTVRITFWFEDFDSTAQGSFLLIDDLSLVGNYLHQDEVNRAKFHFYPNPVKDFLHIEGPGIRKVSLIDQKGQFLKIGSPNLIDMSGLVPGIYYLLIETEDAVFYEKIVKE